MTEWLTLHFNFHLLLSHFSCVRLCVTSSMAAHQAPPSLGFSRQEHWSGLPFPSPMHENEKWKWSRSVVSDSLRPHGLQPTRLLHPWDFPGKSTGVGCHCLLCNVHLSYDNNAEGSFGSKPQLSFSSWHACMDLFIPNWKNCEIGLLSLCSCSPKGAQSVKAGVDSLFCSWWAWAA